MIAFAFDLYIIAVQQLTQINIPKMRELFIRKANGCCGQHHLWLTD